MTVFPLFILSSLPKKNKAKSRYVQTKKNPISLILARPFLRIKHWGKSVIKEVLSIYLNSFLRQKRYPKCSLEIYTWPTYLILTMIYSNSLLLKRWLICLFAFPSTLWQLYLTMSWSSFGCHLSHLLAKRLINTTDYDNPINDVSFVCCVKYF